MSAPASEAPRAASRRYWIDRLSAFTFERARLPGPGPAAPRPADGTLSILLSPDADAALRGVAGSPFLGLVAVSAGVAVALYRQTGRRNVVLATPAARRSGEASNTLVHRAVIDPSRSFRAALDDLRAAMLEADRHHHFPFPLLLEALGLSLEDHDLFDVLVTHGAWHDAPLPSGERIALRVDTDHRRTSLSAAFDRRAVAADGVRILLERTAAVLQAGLTAPETTVAALDLIGPVERHRILEDWHPPADESKDELLDWIVARRARERPERVAVVDAVSGASMTYADLDGQAARLARSLAELALRNEETVGICIDPSPRLVVALLAAWKAGAACALLDAAAPPSRVQHVLDDAHVRVVIAASALRARFEGPSRHVVAIDEPEPHAGDEGRVVARDPRQVAYVMYTSGSTGRPKGVMVEHRRLVNYLRWAVRAYGLDENACVPLTSSPAFDLALTALLAPLMCGGRVVLGPPLLTLEGLRATLEGPPQFTLIKATPLHVLALGDALAPGALRDAAPALVIGGELLRESHVERWRTAAPGVRLFNEYGPTEATVGCCVFENATPDSSGVVPIGRPAANARLYVLDADVEPVPDNVPGELYIGGPVLARGYLGQPAETASRFVPDPFSPVPGSCMYRTADVVVRRDDGNLLFLGRSDRQVKVRGYRIELAEIEGALLEVPGVKAAAAAVRDANAQGQITAWIVADGVAPPLRALRRHLGEHLPEYMMPASVVVVEALPLTRNGKVDVVRLLAREAEAAEERGDAAGRPLSTAEAPTGSTEAEQVLLAIWREVLEVPELGPNDNVLEFGGDSIVSIRVVGRARQAGWRILPSQMFEYPTVAALARVAERCPSAGDATVEEGDAPLSPIQRWFLDHGDPSVHRMCVTRLLQLSRRLDAPDIEAALRLVVRRHDALRLRVYRASGNWQQTVSVDQAHPLVASVDLGRMPVVERESAMKDACDACMARLDIGRGPVIQAVLFTHDDRPPSLFIAIHHFAADHFSWTTILQDIESFIADPRVPQAPASFARWARRLEKRAASGAFDADARYWLETCADVDAAAWPAQAGAARRHEGATETRLVVALDEEDTRTVVDEMHGAYNTKVADALLTALVTAVSHDRGAASLLVDLESAGRECADDDDADVASAVGWFTALYPVRLSADASGVLARSLVRVKETLRQVPGDGRAFGAAKYLSSNDHLRRALAALPQPDIAFNYFGQVAGELRRDGMFGSLPGNFGERRQPGAFGHRLEVNALVVNRRLVTEFVWESTLDLQTAVGDLAAAYLDALRSLAAECIATPGPGATPSDFPLVTLDEAALAALLDEVSRGDEAGS